jgi:hypothetical protein
MVVRRRSTRFEVGGKGKDREFDMETQSVENAADVV